MIALLRKISLFLAVAKAVKRFGEQQAKNYKKRNSKRAKLKRFLLRR